MGEGGCRVLPPEGGRQWGRIQKRSNASQRQMTVRTRLEREEDEKSSSHVERLGKEILGLREELSRIAENMVTNDQQLVKLDADYRALRRTGRHVAEEVAREQRAHDETKAERNGLKLIMRQISGWLWRYGC